MAERISVRTERDALSQATTPPSVRLITRATQTRPIRRSRSDIALPSPFNVLNKMTRRDKAAYRVLPGILPVPNGKICQENRESGPAHSCVLIIFTEKRLSRGK
jgi:hypothetical protein